MHRTLLFTILAVVLIAAAVPAHAAGLTGAGLQIGWSTNPDDFLVGFHYNARPLGEELDLVPSLDFGFGDVTMIAPNLDAHYVLKTSSKLMPYIGAGVTFPWYDFDGGSEWEFGGAIVSGVHINPNIAFEAKYGLGDAPDWKFVFLLHK
jgi:opacity protein-like surface antigen